MANQIKKRISKKQICNFAEILGYVVSFTPNYIRFFKQRGDALFLIFKAKTNKEAHAWLLDRLMYI